MEERKDERCEPRFTIVETVDRDYDRKYGRPVLKIYRIAQVLLWITAGFMIFFGCSGAAIYLFAYFRLDVPLGTAFLFSVLLIAVGAWQAVNIYRSRRTSFIHEIKAAGDSFQCRFDFYDTYFQMSDPVSAKVELAYDQICAVRDDGDRFLLFTKKKGISFFIPKEFFDESDPREFFAFLQEKIEPGQKIPIDWSRFYLLVFCTVFYFAVFGKLIWDFVQIFGG